MEYNVSTLVKILLFVSRRHFNWLQFISKCIFLNHHSYIKQLLIPYRSSHSLRHSDHPYFFVPRILKETGQHASKFKAPSDWNNLPGTLRSITSFHLFKTTVFTYHLSACVIWLYVLYFLYLCVKDPLENEMVHLKGFILLMNVHLHWKHRQLMCCIYLLVRSCDICLEKLLGQKSPVVLLHETSKNFFFPQRTDT